jgi:hypothetical protein
MSMNRFSVRMASKPHQFFHLDKPTTGLYDKEKSEQTDSRFSQLSIFS